MQSNAHICYNIQQMVLGLWRKKLWFDSNFFKIITNILRLTKQGEYKYDYSLLYIFFGKKRANTNLFGLVFANTNTNTNIRHTLNHSDVNWLWQGVRPSRKGITYGSVSSGRKLALSYVLFLMFGNLLWPNVKSNLRFFNCLWVFFSFITRGKILVTDTTTLHYTEVYPCTLHYTTLV